MPKYSIIIPARNGAKYLPSCVNSIIEQTYDDYELIISDDHSTDESKSYLATLTHPNIRILEPTISLSMTEHWEWALSKATGEWLIFVGQDDGLQPYFFQLADILTEFADAMKTRAIMSERAYFFWKGCEFIYGDISVLYNAYPTVKMLNSRLESLKALLGIQNYFELPEMYTTSLFHRNLLEEARVLQSGRVFCAHPQDANLAAIACSLEKVYLKSSIPLGWVGSSPKSAGMAISSSGVDADNLADRQELDKLKKEYEEKISQSELQYHYLAGNFGFGSTCVYFWQALIQTTSLRRAWINKLLLSKGFRVLLFACAIDELKRFSKFRIEQKNEFQEILRRNRLSSKLVYITYLGVFSIRFLSNAICLPFRAMRKINRLFSKYRIKVRIKWSENTEMSMGIASSLTANKILDIWPLVSILNMELVGRETWRK